MLIYTVTSDVQIVIVMRKEVVSIDIECHFINGSDAQGCKVVVVSNHSSVDNITTMLIRQNESDTTVSGQVNLTYHIDCYHHVLSFDIEANGTISSLATREEIESDQPLSNSHCLNSLVATPKGKNDK